MGTINDLFIEMDQLMDQMVRRMEPFRTEYAAWQPRVDVYERPDRLVIVVELGGVRSEDLKMSVLGSELVITGVRRSPAPPGTTVVHQLEIECGRFMRRLRMSHPIEQRNISARFVDGLLTIELLEG
ncbi:MAG: Hsp20/alpha crystallin family protein [Candidatus Hydrogenedentes bacterium]|nr:Hsp20/alpha crystallin family protein [Candidatus Hydrogenedentota bacterium]